MPKTGPQDWPLISKARFSAWRKLRLRKEREKTGQILIEGLRLTSEAVQSGLPVEAILTADDAGGRDVTLRMIDGLKHLSASKSSLPPVLRISRSDLEQLTDTMQTSGIAAVVKWQARQWSDFSSTKARRLVYCDHVGDPGNLGTLIRTAAGLGLDAVLVSPESVEPANPKVVRSTAGALFRIPVYSPVSVEESVEWAKRNNGRILLADATHKSSATPGSVSDRWILTIGGETHGLSPEWGNHPSERIGIRMANGVESLNAAVAGALLMDRLMTGRT